ncbi:hypothetical protein PIB30_061848 [Stylosanthes scabra]|uniref:Uncharacterized protein n=1 Tax=Stylosanthes scabra TaxID=79078 RepID=A0ABU6ULH5_9FABA|nr:hypothetical protein [Stylosanthes scabra]
MVHNEVIQEEEEEDEEEEGEDDWLYELLAELASSVESDDEEEVEEEIEKEVVEKKDEEETFFIATIFSGNKKVEEVIPSKCEDPGPYLVKCKIRGVDTLECLCDRGACGSVMPFELYEALDLGPLKKSKEVFTIVDARKTTEVFHLTLPPTPRRKGAHQFQIGNEEIKPDKPLKSEEGEKSEELKTDSVSLNSSTSTLKESFKRKGLRNAPPKLKKKKKKKKAPFNLEKKKEMKKKKKKKHEEDEPKKKVALKCSSFNKLLGKLRIFKEVLHHHKSMDTHLVKDNSKWKWQAREKYRQEHHPLELVVHHPTNNPHSKINCMRPPSMLKKQRPLKIEKLFMSVPSSFLKAQTHSRNGSWQEDGTSCMNQVFQSVYHGTGSFMQTELRKTSVRYS